MTMPNTNQEEQDWGKVVRERRTALGLSRQRLLDATAERFPGVKISLTFLNYVEQGRTKNPTSTSKYFIDQTLDQLESERRRP